MFYRREKQKMRGKRIGYVRVSTIDQNPDRQLVNYELDKKFVEYASGKNIKRPQLEAMLDYIREDDELFVHSIDRLARSVKDLHHLIDTLLNKKVTVYFVKQNLTFSGNDSPLSRFQLTLLGAVAELEREIILERQREGIAEAQKKGKYKGGCKKLDADKIEVLKKELEKKTSKSQIAKDLGVCRFTIYKYIDQLNLKKTG